jgi:hypothetical protein
MKKYISLLIILTSCVYPFDLDENMPEKLLVVEGYVSDQLKDSEIRLSYSNTFKTRVFEMVSGAQVEVLENDNISHAFIEKEPGLYIPADSLFMANPQSAFKLHMVIDNKTYESSEVKIKRSAVIDKLDFKAVDKYSAGERLQYRALDILNTTVDDPDASRYYRYSVAETWLVTSVDTFDQKINPTFTTNSAGDPIDIEWNVESNLQTTYCWVNSYTRGISPTSTEGLVRNQLVAVPVFTVSLENLKLRYKYSALIKQYSIPKDAHHFLTLMNQFSENDVSLFDTQPGFVEGNIKCLSNENENVIGIFYASDVVEDRIFIRILDLSPSDRIVVYRNSRNCPIETIEVPVEGDKTPSLIFLRDSLIYGRGYVVANLLSGSDADLAIMTYEYCADCRVMGSNIKPDFWGSLTE